jgi:transposase
MRKVYDQRVETFISCHINAFEYFRGIPEVVKIDNLKAAVLEANFYEPSRSIRGCTRILPNTMAFGLCLAEFATPMTRGRWNRE